MVIISSTLDYAFKKEKECVYYYYQELLSSLLLTLVIIGMGTHQCLFCSLGIDSISEMLEPN